MRSPAFLVRLQKVSARDLAIFLRYENFVLGREPVGQGRVARHVAGQRVGLACADHRLENAPDTVGVGVGRSTDGCHAI